MKKKQEIKQILFYVLLPLFIFSSEATAITICALDCPASGGDTDSTSPQIVEFISLDGSRLELEIDGLIFLDRSVFEGLSSLAIAETTTTYDGLDSIPSDITIPDAMELNEVSFTGGLTLTGGIIDYVLLRQFADDSELVLSATNGIVVLDTDSLFVGAVPLPAAIWLFGSGLLGLIGMARRKGA